MKKIIISIIVLFIAINANAQWTIINHKADELTENEAYTEYVYTLPEGKFIIYKHADDSKTSKFEGISDKTLGVYLKDIKQPTPNFAYAERRADILIGFYQNDILNRKESLSLACGVYNIHNDTIISITKFHKDDEITESDIIWWLFKKGDIRIVFDGGMDVVIPMIK